MGSNIQSCLPDLCSFSARYKSFVSKVFLRPLKNVGNVYLQTNVRQIHIKYKLETKKTLRDFEFLTRNINVKIYLYFHRDFVANHRVSTIAFCGGVFFLLLRQLKW